LLFSYLYFLIFNWMKLKILFIEFLSYLSYLSYFFSLRRIQRVQFSPRNHRRFSCSWISRQSIAGCLLWPSKSPRNQIAARKKHWRQPMNKSCGDDRFLQSPSSRAAFVACSAEIVSNVLTKSSLQLSISSRSLFLNVRKSSVYRVLVV